MLACKRLVILFVRMHEVRWTSVCIDRSGAETSNRASSPYMSKISCIAAGKYDLSYGFVNVWGGGVNSYKNRTYVDNNVSNHQ